MQKDGGESASQRGEEQDREKIKELKSDPWKAFKSPLWVLGLITQITAAMLQAACLPYADLTLIACNCTFAILFIQLLAIVFLGE